MKTLYLLRHAKAESGMQESGDKGRALSARGRDACAAMGAYMKKSGYQPDFILCSSSARTRETLELVAKAAQMNCASRFEDTLYLASADDVLHSIHTVHDSNGTLMIVGHNPGMHHIALLLAQPRRTKLRAALELKYPTGALSVLQFDKVGWRDVKAAEGWLSDFTTPEAL